jgi:hypothetical protein
MDTNTSTRRGVRRALAVTLGASLAWIGVAMGGTHVPVAIEPDAPHAEHVGVATFALG